jgi:hypothetical protein
VPADTPFLAALGRHAAASPADPFLIFRGARGHFRWWPFAEALGRAAGCEAPEERADEAEAAAFLRAAAAASAGVESLAGELTRSLPAPQGRDVWISRRETGDRMECALALWAAASGAAIVREPAPHLHPALFAWARPTVVADGAAALAALCAGFAAEAPKLGAARWRRRRLARLRAVLVEEGDAVALGEIGATLASLGARSPLVLPFRATRW